MTDLFISAPLLFPMDDKIFEALSHPLRRRALRLLGERPRMYSELMEELGVDSPTLAFHLKKLAGLVEKGNNGFYRLTELGRRALEVMAMVEGAGQPQPRTEAEELTFSDRILLKIDKALLELAKKEGRKIKVFDTAILEIDKDVPPELFYEVVEEVRDVAVVKVPKHLRSYVEPKARDVGLITERGLLTSTLKLAVQLLGYLGPLKAFRREKKSLVEVYSGDFRHGGRVAVEVEGGRLKIVKGPNRVVARCEDQDDFEISEGAVSMEGCEVEMSLDGVDALNLDVAGGYVAAALELNNLNIDIAGGVVDVDLTLGRGSVSIEAEGGAVSGRLSYASFDGSSELDVSAVGGVVSLLLELPPDVGISVESSVAGGVVKTPKPRPGARGILKVSVDAVGGAVRILTKE